MAYGKIKADTLVFDNSGSDVELAISTIATGSLSNYAPLAGATFTGGITGTTAGFTGNVGIGTTSPAKSLEIFNDSFPCLMLNDGGQYKSYMQLGGNDLEIRGSSGAMEFYTGSADGLSSTERMRIDSSGRLLVGTTTEGAANEADNVTISGTDDVGITLRSTNSAINRIYFSDGTSGTSEYAGYQLYNHSSNAMIFGTDATERMRIDSSGRLLVGATSPYVSDANFQVTDDTNAKFVLNNPGNGTYSLAVANDSALAIKDEANGIERMRIDTSGTVIVKAASADKGIELEANGSRVARFGVLNPGVDHDVYIGTLLGNGFSFRTNNTERMRIVSSGRVLIGKTTTNFAVQGIELRENGEMTLTRQGDLITTRRIGTEGTHFSLRNISGTAVGTIVTTSSSTAYNTSSDYRLKENIVNIADGITRVKQLAPKRFNFIADDTTTVDGFIAHEAQTVVPEAVTGEKDGEEMQGIDQSKLVPLLTAALQEAIAKIETLEAKVTVLEGA